MRHLHLNMGSGQRFFLPDCKPSSPWQIMEFFSHFGIADSGSRWVGVKGPRRDSGCVAQIVWDITSAGCAPRHDSGLLAPVE